MSKPNLVRSEFLPYHVYARANNKEWFYVSKEAAWKIFSDSAFNVSIAYGAHFHSFVLMPNHFHALLSTPDKNLDGIMNYFMRETARALNRESNRINHAFGGTYKWTVIASAIHFSNTYKYIYRNPVSCGLSERVEAYPFSTIGAQVGLRNLTLPLWLPTKEFDRFINIDYPSLLKWLNTPTKPEHIKAIKNALSKRVFKLSKSSGKKISDLETNLC